MYGLINSALKSMVTESFGEAKWQAVLQASGVPEDSFLTMRSYDDDISYQLVAASAEVLETPAADCLEMFGRYWVLEVATKTYANLMDSSGTSLLEFLENLNALHDRITSVFLDYAPPEFRIVHGEDGVHQIHYISQRDGLTPFVDGLLCGLAQHFDQELTVLNLEHRHRPEGTHAVYQVTVA